ncbi:drug/metabolite transporter (DMT)-like permease [Rhodoligotrophos appendicifer]|uniref:DMT family transporter n=1 Tax=Rhodoligotrophos appendicifer TaxID=987056 RepID=UPI0011855DAA|nr:DMT family transporter [Rhodoligotrophos appendicifer]
MASLAIPMLDHRRGLLIGAIGGLIMTFDAPLLRLAQVETFTAVFWRGLFVFIGTLLLWAWLRYIQRRPTPLINGRDGIVIALLHCIANVLFVSAMFNTAVANVVFILALNPLFAALFSLVWLGERITLATWLAMIAALIGVSIIVMGGIESGSVKGDVLALGSVMMIGFGLTYVRRSGKDLSLAPGPGSLLAALIALPFAATLAIPMEKITFLALDGLLVMPLASALLIAGARYLSAPEVAMFFLLETVLAPVWIWLMIGEVPTLNTMIGGAVILVSLIAHAAYRLSRPPPLPR